MSVFRDEKLSKPFARWDNIIACILEQKSIGHSEPYATKICEGIKERADKGTLFKATPNLEVLKGVGDDLVVGGIASWEMVDPENDYVTTKAMTRFLTKFFSLPEEYRNISIDHTNFQIGKALLSYPEDDPKYFSHVHEKGMYLIAKIRNDKLARTIKYRKEIKEGKYKMYSISGEPMEHKSIVKDNTVIREIYDIDPFEVAIVKEGVNPKAAFKLLAKKDIQKPFADYDSFADCVAQNQDKENPEAFCAWLEHRTTGKWPTEKALLKISKITTTDKTSWMAECNKICSDLVKNPAEFCGAFWNDREQWYHGPVKTTLKHPKKKIGELTFQQEVEKIFRKHFPEHKGDP